MTAIRTASDCYPVRPLHILYEWFRHLAQTIEGVSKLSWLSELHFWSLFTFRCALWLARCLSRDWDKLWRWSLTVRILNRIFVFCLTISAHGQERK